MELPYRLIRLLSFTDDVVCDPFVGSGTTAVACQQMKRHFIAVEINPEYAQIATSRLKTPEPEPAPAATAPADEEQAPDEITPEASDDAVPTLPPQKKIARTRAVKAKAPAAQPAAVNA